MTDIELMGAYMAAPETNKAAFGALFQEAMAEIQYAATMKVVSVIMREVESCQTDTKPPSV